MGGQQPHQPRKHQIQPRQHPQRPGDAVEAGEQIALAEPRLGQRQVGGQVQRQVLIPAVKGQLPHQRCRQHGIIARQDAHRPLAPEGAGPDGGGCAALCHVVGGGQKQAEGGEQDHHIHPHRAAAGPEFQRPGPHPALLPDVEPSHTEHRHHPHKIRRSGAGQAVVFGQNAHSPSAKRRWVSPFLPMPSTRVSGAPIITSSWMAESLRPFSISWARVSAAPPLIFVG